MFSGVIAVIVKGIYDVGGISNLFEICYEGGRLNFFNFDPNPLVRQSFWSLLIGGRKKNEKTFSTTKLMGFGFI